MIGRRLLMGGGGSFSTPITGGILTIGSPTTITNDTYYNAWPVVTRLANGTLLCAYTKAITHHGDNTGNAVMKTSTDSGSTWSAESSIYFDVVTPLFSSVFGVSQISTGRIFATLWRDDWDTPGTGEAGIAYSDNNGTSWSSWIDLTNGFTQEAFATGPVIELPNGDLITTIEGSNTGDPVANRSCHTLLSTDDGATWGSETVVRNYATDTRPYYESKLVLLDTNELIVLHRTSGLAGTHYIQRSSDQGATAGGWSVPAAIFTGYAAPATIQSTARALISVTRRNSDAAAVAHTSIDLGTTWSSAYVLDATMFEMEYGEGVELSDGRILFVYGSQPTSAQNNADIKQVIATAA